jgi:hypothetical protein
MTLSDGEVAKGKMFNFATNRWSVCASSSIALKFEVDLSNLSLQISVFSPVVNVTHSFYVTVNARWDTSGYKHVKVKTP